MRLLQFWLMKCRIPKLEKCSNIGMYCVYRPKDYQKRMFFRVVYNFYLKHSAVKLRKWTGAFLAKKNQKEKIHFWWLCWVDQSQGNRSLQCWSVTESHSACYFLKKIIMILVFFLGPMVGESKFTWLLTSSMFLLVVVFEFRLVTKKCRKLTHPVRIYELFIYTKLLLFQFLTATKGRISYIIIGAWLFPYFGRSGKISLIKGLVH